MVQSSGTPRLPLERSDALSISSLYKRVVGALVTAFPRSRPLWVRGEIQSISDRTGHCYIDLVDPDGPRDRSPVLKVRCWSRTWNPMKTSLARQGVALEVGMVVVLRGVVDFYAPKAEVNFVLAEVDITALLGRLAARRAVLLETLRTEGLLTRNHGLSVGEVPLRIVLVASPGTEGYRDFMGQLSSSGLAFEVRVIAAQVQGSGAAASVAAGIRSVAAQECDVVVVVRGGGSRADLVAFDAEPIARAIATAPVPVWTGIGHTGDQSVADIVAHQSFITPTECGQELVRRVAEWWRSVARRADAVTRLAQRAIERAQETDAVARTRLGSASFRQLQRHTDHAHRRASTVALHAARHVDASAVLLDRTSERLVVCARSAMDRQRDRTVSWRRLLGAYDVGRQLERGYTITADADGRIVRSAVELSPGATVFTRFADGSVRSVVDEVVPT